VTLLATSLGVDHGGFDIAMVGRQPYVFEFNRIFGNRGLEGLQQKTDEAITQYLLNKWGSYGEPDSPEPLKPLRGPHIPYAV